VIVPELTYQYAQMKDIAGGTLIVVNVEGSDALTNVSVFPTVYTVPGDKILVLSCATGIALPGAGQICTELNFVVSINTISFEFYRSGEVLVNSGIRSGVWSGELWIPPEASILGSGVFDAGANSNSVTFTIHGVLIPRGNVQRG